MCQIYYDGLQLMQPVFSNTINVTDSRTYEPVNDHSDCSLIKWEGQPPNSRRVFC